LGSPAALGATSRGEVERRGGGGRAGGEGRVWWWIRLAWKEVVAGRKRPQDAGVIYGRDWQKHFTSRSFFVVFVVLIVFFSPNTQVGAL
jgi:hypothetical protein